jgi:acyl carrier protein
LLLEESVSIKEEIRSYLAATRGAGDMAGLSDSASLLEAGVVDSVAMVDLIAHIEGEYGIRVDEDDMTPENFDSIDAIAGYVEGKRTVQE